MDLNWSLESRQMFKIRRILLCLLMLALPLQGFAAAAMLYCGTGPAHQAMQHTHPGDLVDTALQTQTDLSADQAQAQLPDAAHKCGVCAACCSVLALGNMVHAITAPSLPPADLAEPLVLIDNVPSRQLEKPPRA